MGERNLRAFNGSGGGGKKITLISSASPSVNNDDPPNTLHEYIFHFYLHGYLYYCNIVTASPLESYI